MKITIENRSKVTLHGLKPGHQKQIDADENGTPIKREWRRRLLDSKLDGAIIVIETAIHEQ